MKYSDIDKIHRAGLITEEQRRRIIEEFSLKPEGSKFLAIISMIGGTLVACGITLLIASHWDEIHRWVKLAAGIALMVGAHGVGHYLREVRRTYRKTGEALHLVGACLFLANIALVGQIYNLSSRPPNAVLLWLAGIAALPWLLRSRALHLLALAAFGIWLGLEVNTDLGWLHLGFEQYQMALYALVGLVLLGGGYCLRETEFSDFAEVTESIGLLAFLVCAFPLCIEYFYADHSPATFPAGCVLGATGALAMVLLGCGIRHERSLTEQWRWTWFGALASAAVLVLAAWWVAPHLPNPQHSWRTTSYYSWVVSVGLFVFSIIQIQVGVQTRSGAMVNLAVLMIGAVTIAVYLMLFGSMARTGLMFVVSGVFLIGLGVYLEKKRRRLLDRMKVVEPATRS